MESGGQGRLAAIRDVLTGRVSDARFVTAGRCIMFFLLGLVMSCARVLENGAPFGMAMVACSVVFSWFIGMSSRYALVYGSLASLIILLVWLYLCGNILLIGAAVSRTWVIRRTR